MKKIIFFILLLCVGCQQTRLEPSTGQEYQESNVQRYVDREAGVVCWIYKGTTKGGISCLPISETKLRE